MTYLLKCVVDECTRLDYGGTMTILSVFAGAGRPEEPPFHVRLAGRTGVKVDGQQFHILAADPQYDTVTSESLVVSAGEEDARIVTEGFRKRDLKKTLGEMMGRSRTRRMYVLLEWNGAASAAQGAPVPHQRVDLEGLLDLVERDQLRENLLYVVTGNEKDPTDIEPTR